jgi:Mce-associated membrane protein
VTARDEHSAKDGEKSVADETADNPGAENEASQTPESDAAPQHKRAIAWTRVLAYGVLPALALLAALGAGYLKWVDTTARDADTARIESVRVATDGTVAMLSYKPDTVERDLGGAQDRLTGQFKDSYYALIHDVVIPGAKQRQIAAIASVPATAWVSATTNHAVVLLFVNQTVTIGTDAPTSTASSVRVTLDKIGGRWLISDFTPV